MPTLRARVGADYLASKGHRALISRREADQKKQTMTNRRNPNWRRHEVKFVRDHLGEMGYAEISQQLGRSEIAVKLLQVRRQIPAPSKRPGYLTGQGMAKMMGCDIHSVMLYAEREILPFERVPGKQGFCGSRRCGCLCGRLTRRTGRFLKLRISSDKKLKRLVKLARSAGMMSVIPW